MSDVSEEMLRLVKLDTDGSISVPFLEGKNSICLGVCTGWAKLLNW
jgi:hypothetical protein